jgi:hypothetical protein
MSNDDPCFVNPRTRLLATRAQFGEPAATAYARFALHGAWRVGPRFSVEELNNPTLGGKQTIYLPQVRGDWTSRKSIFEAIAGYQLTQQQVLPGQTQTGASDQRSLYISLAYRLRF